MLVLKIMNTSYSTPDYACHYDVEVYLNTRKVWAMKFGPFARSQGWFTLVTKIAEVAAKQTESEREKTKEILHSQQLLMNTGMRCPLCKGKVATVTERTKGKK